MTTFETEPDALFAEHLAIQLARYHRAMDATGHDALVIAAGCPGYHYLDDIETGFKPNPHFRLLSPLAAAAGSSIVLRPGRRACLLHLRSRDFWHLPPPAASGEWTREFEILEFDSTDALSRERDRLLAQAGTAAAIDPDGPAPDPALLARLDHARAHKTRYEIACMERANGRAARGHRAARDAFLDGAAEFEIHLAYLQATQHVDEELPYGNIIALNEHAAVLHYQHRDREPPASGHQTFLIDAGACWNGYAADITRTHCGGPGPFADLVRAMDQAQQALVADVRPGIDFVELHRAAHHAVGRILIDAGIARGEADSLVETGVTSAFLPHGLGHLIGVQTHDVGGRLADAGGALRPPPEAFPALRLTRALEEDFVLTIEPGLYFIPMLLEPLRESRSGHAIDWKTVDALLPFGGIRIEDDVRVTGSGCQNLTRPALAAEGLA